MITTEQIKTLRDQTGISVMKCKQALEEADGDIEQARTILNQKSGATAQKKADRETSAGAIVASQENNAVGVVVLRCETDFVADNDEFKTFAETIAEKARADTADAQAYADEHIAPVIQKIGENIQVERIEQYSGDPIAVYVHNNEHAAIVSLTGGTYELAYDIAMHAAAMKPHYITEDDITDDDKQQVRDIYEKEVAEMDKPEEIKEKILAGKLDTHFKEKTLVSQPFIKDSEQTIGDLLATAGATIEHVKLYQV